MKHIILLATILTLTLFSCTSKTEKQSNISTPIENSKLSNENKSYENLNTQYSNEENYNETDISLNGCNYEDGTHSATVYYNNDETGYSASYTLDVEVQDCQIVQINFPNNGYIDEDHISYADIDEDGNATVEGENGKMYEIQIDN